MEIKMTIIYEKADGLIQASVAELPGTISRADVLLPMISLESQPFNCIKQLNEVAFAFVFDA
jgi:hypothetical protein